MTKAPFILVLLSLIAGVTEQANCQQILQCSVPSTRAGADDGFVQPKSAEEVARLKQAPHGAKRLGTHAIEVGWAKGKRIVKISRLTMNLLTAFAGFIAAITPIEVAHAP
ncbi:MAG TPA: hypothetical protein VGK21_07700 [Candidatus Angelobacter sp.]|jgi:hypothetical protein